MNAAVTLGGRIALWLTLCVVAVARDVYPAEQERVGTAAAAVTWAELARDGAGPGLSPGAAVSIDARVAQRVALMLRGAWWPQRAPPRLHIQGGKTVHAFGGLRADVIKRRRSAVYAGVLLGVVHASHAIVAITADEPRRGHRTLFAVRGLLGLEVNATERWLARIEFGRTQVAINGAEVGRSEPGENGSVLILVAPPARVSRNQVSVGAGFRFGPVVPAAFPPSGKRRWHIVPQFTYAEFAANTVPRPNLNVDRGAALGVLTAYHVSGHVGVEALVSASLRANEYRTPYYGGHELQTMAGIKVGGATQRMGVFGKLRGGVLRYSSVVKGLSSSGAPDRYGALNAVAGEIGAVAEVYVRPRHLLRFDVADVFVRGREVTLTVPEGSIRGVAQGTTRRLQISIGFGWTM